MSVFSDLHLFLQLYYNLQGCPTPLQAAAYAYFLGGTVHYRNA